MKIAFISEWFKPVIGGAGNQADLLAHELAKNPKIEIDILTKRTDHAPTLEKDNGITIKRFGPPTQKGKISDYSSSFKLFNYLNLYANSYDIIHIHGNIENNFNSVAALVGKNKGVPVLGKLAIHGEMKNHLESDHYSSLQKFLKQNNPLNMARQNIALSLDGYIAISEKIKQELLELHIDPKKIHTIPNGVQLDRFTITSTKEKEIARTKLKIKPDEKVFLTVSRLARHKGIISPLLETWNSHYSQDEKKKLIIVGGGEGLSSSVEEDVSTYISDHSLTNVVLTGSQKNPRTYYEVSDVFILPSENEGLSNSLLEAAATGLICISTDVSGSKDILGSSFVIPKKNPAALHKTIEKVLTLKPQESKQLIHKQRKHIENTYNISIVAKKIQELYTQYI